MSDDELKVLAELHFATTLTQDDVWKPAQVHVPGLHVEAQRLISRGMQDALHSKGPSPTGVVLNGRSGAGKTHLLGWVRQRLRSEGGYFFLSNLGDSGGFWPNVVEALLQGLREDGEHEADQLGTFLRRLSSAARMPAAAVEALAGEAPLTPELLDDFVIGLRRLDRRVASDCQDTARALALYASTAPRLNNVGYDYLASSGELTQRDRDKWGFRARPHDARRVVSDVTRLLALTGPSVIAVDQIDTLIALSNKSTKEIRTSADDESVDSRIARIADGLMLLRDETRRTLTVVACLPQSWELIRTRAANSVPDRFTVSPNLSRIPDVAVGRELVAARLGQTYERIDFKPPYPTWPVAPSAFDDVKAYTPREVLNRIDRHIEACLRSGEMRELTSFAEEAELSPLSGELSGELPLVSDVDLTAFDARFEELKRTADVATPLDPDREDEVMPALLSAGLAAWIAERGTRQTWSVDSLHRAKIAALHARLRLTLDAELEDEAHWAFRAIASDKARAALNRLDKAWEASGIKLGVPGRTLVLLRNTQWSSGEVTQDHLGKVEQEGGVSVPITEGDLRTFAALRQMLEEHQAGLHDWLAARRPATGTELFTAVLPAGTAETVEAAVTAQPVVIDKESDGPQVPVGRLVADQKSVSVPLASLRKHVVIFAGSGSGKTVLIRRLVEECALLGVSSIVLDPNNDLARLGDRWPQAPTGWNAGDEAKAERYLRETDVVIWTPGKASGRPLVFPPLPDFASVADDVDDFTFAVQSAVASLAPSARVMANTDKARKGKAVLTSALAYYGKSGGRSLDGLINVLSDLPEQISELQNATTIAAELAETLRAAKVIEPFLRETADPVDPGELLAPSPGKNARVSVVSLDGLSSLEERQSFVNRLQMELFAWVKRHPVVDRPLGGLLVMDEAQDLAPSTTRTASTESSIQLASQARKYGLGLILATQAPKAVHNRISGNATTQFFGRQNAPSHIEAAKDLARNKGRDLPDLGLMPPGEFYVTGEGIGFQKVRAPFCLSHHPQSPLTSEEVMDRAKK
ncbi:helicase HerA domain-containing protein [Amycolatopsis sp.]|jgi:DNA helicase HerA-like ATPase|uniref:helicase HerA domain-containing protein n=1 Tax=Amycolatopsis sp. TaxID=37632 RepID=UPI002E015381|nr:DUF87 domain-containing protein [Amycolatopsis sp.]